MDSHQTKDCPICNNHPSRVITRQGAIYFQCSSCKTVYTEPLNQEGLVGGEFEVERNKKHNWQRTERIMEVSRGVNKEDLRVLDFGCGNGLFVGELLNNGFVCAEGYDAYNEKYSLRPKKEYYDVVNMVEVIEHLSAPFVELGFIWRSLKPFGHLIVETSFVDVAKEEDIDLENFFYIAPQHGHSTIFSHHGLDVLMCRIGFMPMPHFDRHVRCYQKLPK